MEHFSKHKLDELADFVAARSNKYKTSSAAKKLGKPRGKKALDEALAGKDNLVKVAFEVRMNESRLSVESHDEQVENAVASNNEEQYPPPLIIMALADPTIDDVKASTILEDRTKMKLIAKYFDPRDLMKKNELCLVPLPMEEPTSKLFGKLLDHADELCIKLQHRLHIQIGNRVYEDQHDHFCLEWARKNLAVVAAWMIYASPHQVLRYVHQRVR